jgi:hypothetical protein
MNRGLLAGAILLACALQSPAASLFDYWGYRAGPGTVVYTNIPNYRIGNPRLGGQFAVIGRLPINEKYGLHLQPELGVRYTSWVRYKNNPEISEINSDHREVFLAPNLVYDLPAAPALRMQPFLLSGIELGYAERSNMREVDPEIDDYFGLFAWNLGGGLAFDLKHSCLVFEARYNSDIIDRVPRYYRRDPVRFNELLILIGIDFPVEQFKLGIK